ncbi:MAG: hypothetical protein ACPGXK_03085 [Phycisphaerae bacterium]
MAILAGIDEAGLGPVLGPLVVSGVVMEIPDTAVDQCLWKLLATSCSREMQKKRRKLAILDSKKLHKSAAGLGALERSALVSLATFGVQPANVAELLVGIAPQANDAFHAYDWYPFADLPLPISAEAGDVGTQRNAVQRDMKLHDITPLAIMSEPLPEGHYNELIDRTRNKAVVLTGQVLRIVDRIIRLSLGQKHIVIHVDRLGGRRHYREPLSRALPGFDMQVLEASETRSAYRMTRNDQIVDIDFGTKGDATQFVVAMASIVSKYLREVSMHAFNRYWCARLETLKPTAGYYQDAQRWLREASDTIAEMGVPRSRLVRQR